MRHAEGVYNIKYSYNFNTLQKRVLRRGRHAQLAMILSISASFGAGTPSLCNKIQFSARRGIKN